jgi:hypothetical protein
MIESLFIFLASIMLTWPAFLGLLVLGIIFEHNEARSWAVFIALVSVVVAYFFFHISLITLGASAVGYVVIGLVWSFYRYKRHASNVVLANLASSDYTKAQVLANLHPKAMLSTITAWITIWPFSLIENLIGDILTAINSLVTTWFRKVYHSIYESAVAALK